MQFSKKRLAVAVTTALVTSQLHAQGGLVLEEITVTAQKTTEMLQDVPVTVTAVTGEVFNQNVAFELEDLNKLVPGLAMNGNKNNPNIALRGVSTIAGGATTPRTNIFMDGAYVPNQQISFLSQFDIQRFEVLKGPQGTLYGKASPTASIVIHTQNPDLTQFEGFARQSFGEHDLANTQFGMSIPLIKDELGIRIAGLYDENNSSDGEYVFADEDQLARTTGGRMTILWEPGSLFSGRLSHTYVDYDSNQSRWFSSIEPGSPVAGLPAEGVSAFDRKDFSDLPRESSIRLNQTIMELNFDMDWAVLTSQTFHATSTNDELFDQDATPVADQTRNTEINFSKLFNQELRLASSGNDVWDWIVGVYYAKNSALTTVDTTIRAYEGPIPVPSPPFPAPFVPGRVTATSDVSLESGSEDWGVFTHNSFFLGDDWTLTIGARWNHEKRMALNSIATDVLTEADLGAGYAPLSFSEGVPDPRSNDTTWIAWTGTIKLAYNLSVDEMLYFTIDRGGRTGGQTLDLSGTTPPDLVEYDPESSNSFEIGYKSEHLDRRLRLNLAAYYQIYNDYQFFTEGQPLDTDLDTVYDGNFRVTQNAKEVVSQGVEAEVTYLFNENFTGMLNISYNDTKFEDFDNAACNNGSPVIIDGSDGDPDAYLECDFGGDRVGSDAGNWGIVAAGNYSLPLHDLGTEWYVDALYNFNSTRVSPITRVESGSYGTVDLFTGLRSLDGTWDVKLWVKNAFDKEATQNINYFERALVNGAQLTGVVPDDLVIDPRQLGITGTYRF